MNRTRRISLMVGGGLLITGFATSAGGQGTGVQSKGEALAAPLMEQAPRCALSGPVGGILIQPDGKIIFAGGGSILFTTAELGTVGRFNGTLARLHPDGSPDPTFGIQADPPSYSSVFDVHLGARADGRLLLTGTFHTVDGQPRSRLALLLPNGKLDPEFIPWRGETNQLVVARPFSPPQLHPAAFDSNGQVVFPALQREAPNGGLRVFRMDDSGRVLARTGSTSGSLHSSDQFLPLLSERGLWLFRPVIWSQPDRTGWSLNSSKADSVLGLFTEGTQLSAGDAAEVLKAIFAELPVELCRSAIRLPDGGTILLVQESDSGRLMRFSKDWQADLSYTNALRMRGYLSLALAPDGKLLVARGTDLSLLGGANVVAVARLNADGSLDQGFNCIADERVMALAVQPDGKIVIGGFFRIVNGAQAPYLARLNPNGSLDKEFQDRFTQFDRIMAGKRIPVRSLHTAAPISRSKSRTAEPGSSAVAPQFILITSLRTEGGGVLVEFSGRPGQLYILQANDRLNSGEWLNMSTNRVDAGGNGVLRDATAKYSPARFYRVAAP